MQLPTRNANDGGNGRSWSFLLQVLHTGASHIPRQQDTWGEWKCVWYICIGLDEELSL